MIRLAQSPQDRAACIAVRFRVFVEEQGVAHDDEIDGEDDACQHVLALVDGHAVGAARFRKLGDAVKIQRVCVLPEQRGTGLGAALIRFVLEQAQGMAGVRRARLSAQVQALDFYRRLGFEAHGPVYDDAGIPHRDMILPLGRTSGRDA